MSCEGCFQTQKAIDMRLADARKRAKEKALRELRPVAIAFENDQAVFYDPFYAVQNNIPFKEVVSHL